MKLTPRALLNLGLLIGAGVLGAVVFLQPGKKPPEKHLVSTLDKNTITHIHIQRERLEDIDLEKRANGWYMTMPYQYPANDFKVDSLLQLARAESQAQYDVAQLDLHQYELDKPRAIVTFNHDQQFQFGGTDPIQQRRYLRYQNTMNLILDIFHYQISAPANGFLNHGLFPENKTITKLVLPKLTAELKEGKWILTPAPKEYSADQITALLDAWRYAQALSVDAYNDKALLPQIKIYRDGQPLPIEFAYFIKDKNLVLIRNDLKLQFTFAADKQKDMLELPPKIEVNEKTPSGNAPKKP